MTISAPVLEKMYRIYEKTGKSSNPRVKKSWMPISAPVLGKIDHFCDNYIY